MLAPCLGNVKYLGYCILLTWTGKSLPHAVGYFRVCLGLQSGSKVNARSLTGTVGKRSPADDSGCDFFRGGPLGQRLVEEDLAPG